MPNEIDENLLNRSEKGNNFSKFLFLSLILVFGPFGQAERSLAATYYIDYKDGSNANNSSSPSTPWKYCPGDANFSAPYTPDSTNGDTFIFKGGVEYQGSIVVANSGGGVGKEMIYRGNTAAGTWGSGKAKLNLNATYYQAFTGTSKNYIRILNFDIYGAKNPRNSSTAPGGTLCPTGQYYIARYTTGSEVPQCVTYSGNGYGGFMRIVGTSSYWTIQNVKLHEGENWQDTCISGAGSKTDSSVFGCDSCAHPSSGLPTDTYGIQIEGSSASQRACHITIDNCEMYAVGRYAILATWVDYLTVTNNDIGGINLDDTHKGWTSQFLSLGLSDHTLVQYNKVHDMHKYIAVNPSTETSARCHAGDWMHWYTNSTTPITNAVIDGNWFYTSDSSWAARLNNSVIGQIQDVSNLRISNNLITNIAAVWGCIFVFGQSGYYKSDNIGIYNNTIVQWPVTVDTPDTVQAIYVCGTVGGGEDNCDLSTVTIKNNLFVNYATNAYSGAPIYTTGTGTPTVDHNVFYNPNAVFPRYITLGIVGGATIQYLLADWQAYTLGLGNGQDVHTQYADPKLTSIPASASRTSSGVYALQADSPAVGNGENLYSIFHTDKNGNLRQSTGAWDIGAYEYVEGGDKTPPAAPSGLTVN